MKKWFLSLLSCLLVLALTACAAPQAPVTEIIPSTEAIVYAQQDYDLHKVSDKLLLLGRASSANNGIACDFTADGIAFEAYIQGEFSFTVNCSKDAYFTVYVDGVRLEQRFEAKGEFKDRKIVVGDLGEMALHSIRILKQTEAKNAIATLKSMQFYGCLYAPAAQKNLYVEFIGDSISCGYGNLWTTDSPDPSNKSGTALYQDGTQGYAFLTAELLDADCSVIGCSGIGIDRSYTNQNGSGYRMIDFYPAASYCRTPLEKYDFSNSRVPDLVVINLGTNDQSVGSTEAAFKTGVKELIEYVRSAYNTDVPIVWAYGMMSEGRSNWTKAVIDEMGGESAGLYMVQLPQNKQGGNGHPSLKAHMEAAQRLSAFIADKGVI